MHEVLREQQFTLARHLRDPAANPPPPGIEDRRLRVYRELFLGAIEGLLAGSFPVIRGTLGDQRWKGLVQAFYATHRSRTPLFTQVAAEFVGYIDGHASDAGLPEWLPELAHYEWIEQSLFSSDAQLPPHDPDGDLFEGVPLLSPLSVPLAYRWPVTDIGPGHVPPIAPEVATTLLVHRDVAHQVRFTRIAPLAFGLLVSLQGDARSGRAHLEALATEAGADPGWMLEQGHELLLALREQGVVIGTAV